MKLKALMLAAGCLSFWSVQAQAGATAKELFIGLDGETTQLAAAPSASPAKPVKPKVLGLQTTIYQLFEDGGVKAVSPTTVFSSGDRIRLGFNANRPGYLYVVNIGSSGKVSTLFPSSATDNNRVQSGFMYQIPQQTGRSIKFDASPGQEVLLVALSESRITSFEYGGQVIALTEPASGAPGMKSAAQQPPPQQVNVAALNLGATSKDLFMEDDGVFQTVVFKPQAQASTQAGPKPLVTALKLTHR